MNHAQLIKRDPARAILLGVYDAPDAPVDFGAEFDFGSDFSTMLDAGADFDFGDDDDYGDDDDDGDFGAAPKRRRINPQRAMQAMKRANSMKQRSVKRGMLMNPNAGSAIKVERYSFNLSTALVLGAASAIAMSDQPDVNIRPERITTNTPWPGFVTISNMRIANVNVTIGTGVADASSWAGNSFNTELNLPTMSPAQRAVVQGNYTGFVPPGYAGAAGFTFTVQLIGNASFTG